MAKLFIEGQQVNGEYNGRVLAEILEKAGIEVNENMTIKINGEIQSNKYAILNHNDTISIESINQNSTSAPSTNYVTVFHGGSKYEIECNGAAQFDVIMRNEGMAMLSGYTYSVNNRERFHKPDFEVEAGDTVVISGKVKSNTSTTTVMFIVGGSSTIDQVQIDEPTSIAGALTKGGYTANYKRDDGNWKYSFKMNGEAVEADHVIENSGGIKHVVCAIKVKGNEIA